MKIGVERSLSNVREYLEKNNESAILLNGTEYQSKKGLNQFDAIVVSGLDSNFLGMHDTSTKVPVINAEGRTAEEVYREIKDRLR